MPSLPFTSYPQMYCRSGTPPRDEATIVVDLAGDSLIA